MSNLVCAKCDLVIDPALYDGCDRYYLVGGEIYCEDCFRDWVMDWVESNIEDVASFIGVPVVEVD